MQLLVVLKNFVLLCFVNRLPKNIRIHIIIFLQEANKLIDEGWAFACEATTRGKRRHEMAMTIAVTFFTTGVLLQPTAQPIPVLVEEEEEFPPSS